MYSSSKKGERDNMEKQKKHVMREIWLPMLLACFVVCGLVLELIYYEAHADAGIGTLFLSIIVGMIAMGAAIGAFQRKNRLRCAVWTALLVVCLLCCFAASRIPLCPMCDGECKSYLLRWIHPDIMNP